VSAVVDQATGSLGGSTRGSAVSMRSIANIPSVPVARSSGSPEAERDSSSLEISSHLPTPPNAAGEHSVHDNPSLGSEYGEAGAVSGDGPPSPRHPRQRKEPSRYVPQATSRSHMATSDEETEERQPKGGEWRAAGRGGRGGRGDGRSRNRPEAEEQWVQCDNAACRKWRKLPSFVNMDLLPEKWFCNMNGYDPGRAKCDVAEESFSSRQSTPRQERGSSGRPRERSRDKDTWPAASDLDRAGRQRACKTPGATDDNTVGQKTRRGRTPRSVSSRRGTSGRSSLAAEAKWVQCDSPACGKWRSVPSRVDTASFPEKW
jgi:hypothetical protein